MPLGRVLRGELHSLGVESGIVFPDPVEVGLYIVVGSRLPLIWILVEVRLIVVDDTRRHHGVGLPIPPGRLVRDFEEFVQEQVFEMLGSYYPSHPVFAG